MENGLVHCGICEMDLLNMVYYLGYHSDCSCKDLAYWEMSILNSLMIKNFQNWHLISSQSKEVLENPLLTRIFTWILLSNSGPHGPGSAINRHGDSIDWNILLEMYLYINDFPYILLIDRHYLKWNFVPLLNLYSFGAWHPFRKTPPAHPSFVTILRLSWFVYFVLPPWYAQIVFYKLKSSPSAGSFFLFLCEKSNCHDLRPSLQSCQKHVTKLVFLSKICSEKYVIGISQLLSTTSWNAILKLNTDE